MPGGDWQTITGTGDTELACSASPDDVFGYFAISLSNMRNQEELIGK